MLESDTTQVNVHPPLKGNYNALNKELRMVLTERSTCFFCTEGTR